MTKQVMVVKPRTKRIVFAGNHEQAMSYCRKNGISPTEVISAISANTIRGLPRGTVVIGVGTYKSRLDYYNIADEILASGYKIKEDKPCKD